MSKESWLAIWLLAGTIIGAGVFSLPFVFSQVGLGTGIFYLAIFTAVYSILHYMYAEVIKVSSPNENHQFFYLAKKYFRGGIADFLSFVILSELLFVMLVYLILAPTFLRLVFDFSPWIAFIIFWVLGSVFIFIRLSWMGLADFLGLLAILIIIGIVFFIGLDKTIETAFFKKLDAAAFFLPFGPLLFSLSGRPAIHKVMEEYNRAKERNYPFPLKRIVIWGTVIPALVYLIFSVSILRLNPNVSPEALNSLNFLSSSILALLGIMGFITLWTSYFMIGVNVRDILSLDLKYPSWVVSAAVLFIPLILYFLGFQEFLFVVSFVGSVFLALEAIFVVLLWRKAFPQNNWKWISWPLYAIFFVAMIYEVISFFT